MGMKTIKPDMIIDIMVERVISEEYINIYPTMKTHSSTMNPICVGESFFRAIKYLLFLLIANLHKIISFL